MKKIVTLLLLACLIGLEITPAFADNEFSADIKWQKYYSERKDPWAAAAMSFIIPGLGQYYSGNGLKGGLVFAGWYPAVIVIPTLSNAHGYDALAPAFFSLGLYVSFAAFDAYWTAEEFNARSASGVNKNPWAATVLSLFPGLGQLYAGNLQKGALFLGGFGTWMAWSNSIYYSDGYESSKYNQARTVLELFIFWSMFDAYWTAEEYNTNLRQKHGLTVQLWNGQPAIAYTYSF